MIFMGAKYTQQIIYPDEAIKWLVFLKSTKVFDENLNQIKFEIETVEKY